MDIRLSILIIFKKYYIIYRIIFCFINRLKDIIIYRSKNKLRVDLPECL